MKPDSKKAFGLFLLGFFLLLLIKDAPGEPPTVRDSSLLTKVGAASPLNALESGGIFHPLTEEYLRQQKKELPYDIPATFSPSRIKVFERRSPLELALLPDEGFREKRKTMRSLSLGEGDPDKAWQPLSEEELRLRERALAKKAVEMGAELADSLSLPYFSEGLLWTTQRFNAYRHYLAEQYRLHFTFSEDDAFLTYNMKY